MKTVHKITPKTKLAAAIAVSGTGLLLLAYMILVEDEPGAVPLLLLFGGAGWLALIKYRLRKMKSYT